MKEVNKLNIDLRSLIKRQVIDNDESGLKIRRY